jgi:hypothetical protein
MLSQQEQSEANRLAHELALSSALTIIESVCFPGYPGPNNAEKEGWYNLPTGPRDQETDDVNKAVRYLELRGAVKRHPSKVHLVRVISASASRTVKAKPNTLTGT